MMNTADAIVKTIPNIGAFSFSFLIICLIYLLSLTCGFNDKRAPVEAHGDKMAPALIPRKTGKKCTSSYHA
jgi:hypothetical protein